MNQLDEKHQEKNKSKINENFRNLFTESKQ